MSVVASATNESAKPSFMTSSPPGAGEWCHSAMTAEERAWRLLTAMRIV
jgi:hypothetical protein